ncbi:MAG TPA: hypothetical protein VGD58_12945, partial [Herpetosiphonaceae bacterium]
FFEQAQAEQASTETEPAAVEPSQESAEAEPDMTPFSLSDLGLSDEDLSTLSLDESDTSATAAEEATLPEDMRSDLAETTQPPASSDDEPDMTPFSLADLGLNDDELSFFEQAQAEQAGGESEPAAAVEQPGESAEQEPDMTPFSLADLGLNDDELAFLEQSQAGQELDTTASQQSNEDVDLLFADFDLPTATEENQPETPATSFADQGDQQPELLSEVPAEANLFDETPAVGADEQPFDNPSVAPSTEAEPDMTPFSLADLGLNDDELSFFEQAQAEQAGGESAATPAAEQPGESAEQEPDMTPFSLADLGLSDDELSFFEQAQAEQSATEQPETEPVEDTVQPEETFGSPFSLADLEDDSPFASLDQAAPAADVSANSATDEAATVFDGDTQADDEPLPMELPEGAQAVASAAEAEEVQPAPAQPVASTAAVHMGGDELAAFHSMLEADPENDAMRLAVARMSQNTNDIGQAVEQYKQLIKRGSLLDEVVVDLQDSIADADDPQMLRRLHRLLGDAYMKQNRFREAMDEYSWTLARSR